MPGGRIHQNGAMVAAPPDLFRNTTGTKSLTLDFRASHSVRLVHAALFSKKSEYFNRNNHLGVVPPA